MQRRTKQQKGEPRRPHTHLKKKQDVYVCLGSTRVFVEQERIIRIQKKTKKELFLALKGMSVCVCVYVWTCDPLLPKTPKKERDPRQESVGRATNKQKKGSVLFLKILRHRRGNSCQDNATASAFLPSFAANLKRRKKRRKKKADRRMVLEKRGTEWKKKKTDVGKERGNMLHYFTFFSRRGALLKARKAHRERDALSWKILPYRASPFRVEQKVIPSSFFFVGRRAFCVCMCVKK